MTSTEWGQKATALRGIYFIAAGFAFTLFGASAVAAQTNTAYGVGTLTSNTSGSFDSAFGDDALTSNTLGNDNTASGAGALFGNITGNYNTASGYGALADNVTGSYNTASGHQALSYNTTGHDNIGIGYLAGSHILTGSNNIVIGNLVAGPADESDTIRIGKDQTRTFVAGIINSGIAVTGTDVVVASDGQLGVILSSARFKRDIRDMGRASKRLMELRPVTFRYKQDRTGTIQYGLVAEEVARVYPELVTYGVDGKVETVRYSELTGMLLNELQRQTGQVRKISTQVRAEQREIAELKADRDRERARRAAFEARLSALEQTSETRSEGGKLATAFNN